MARRPTISPLVLGMAIALALLAAVGRAADQPVSFARDVKPILARKCFRCHGPTAREGGLRLDDPDAVLAELDSGLHAIVPGNAADSALMERVTSNDESVRMPPEGKPLTPEEVEALRRWIAAGAHWEKHWAFVAPQPQTPPQVRRQSWVQNPIDTFILARLEQADLDPAPPADKRTLARRAYFTVTGLPPTEEQLDAFAADSEPDAWPRLIDQLLASPHYGEHWARHWLDLVRFAETNSFERDGLKPNAWKYRDYVIRSFNDDKPYDQFLREQLAGDELDEVTDDTMIATGYYRLGTWDDEPADLAQARADEMDDIIVTTTQTMLGITVGCARCHDHKIDPIPQTDYYGMAAFLADVTPYADIHERDPARYSLWDMSKPDERSKRKQLKDKLDEIRQEMTAMEDVGIGRMSAAEQELGRTPDREALIKDKLQQRLNISEWELYQDAIKRRDATAAELAQLPAPDSALALARCESHPAPTHVFTRGNPHVPGDEVAPHFPALFGDAPPAIPPAAEGARSAGRRRVLAEWITSPRNMLTARVIVNRVWQHHFGRGIVRTSSNFGELGTPPTHPELLDWLALWLIDHDWQLKPLHRLIMTSSAYQMSSTGEAPLQRAGRRGLDVDPTNDLFWRYDMRRLGAEEIRDATLAASGQLNLTLYGPSVYPTLSQEVLDTQSRPGDGWGQSSPEDQARRSVYIHVKRSLLTPLLTAFDFPDVDAGCEARFVTIQPGQALAMLNGDFLNDQARKLAARVSAAAKDNPRDQIALTIRYALGRAATKEETADGLALIARLTQEHGLEPREALRYWCLTVLNLNEFVYLD